MKRPVLQNKQFGVLGMLFRAQNVFGSFEKRAPAEDGTWSIVQVKMLYFGAWLVDISSVGVL